MKQILTDTERTMLEKYIAETEKQTGAQIVLATIRRSDSYAEIPWKAFAIGVSLSGLVVLCLDLFALRWITVTNTLFSVALILAAGLIFVLLSVLVPGIGRQFVSASRKETETMQYAESLFLSHELFSTESRRGILLLLSQFERQVVILPDKGVSKLLSKDVLNNIISNMTIYLRRFDIAFALETGLEDINAALGAAESGTANKNELSDEIIEEEGV